MSAPAQKAHPGSPVADVLTFGETMLSVQSDAPLATGSAAHLSTAGAESNVAIGLARLGHHVRWAGRIGADEPGRLVLRTLRGEGVDVSCATIAPDGFTGAMLRERLVADVGRVHYWRAGSAAAAQQPDHIAPALAAGARILHVTGIACALGSGPRAAVATAVEHAHEHGWTVVMDVNHRSRLWSTHDAQQALRPLRRLVDVLIASDDELPIVAGADGETDEARRVADLLAAGVGEVVVKRGSGGADLHTADGRHLHQPAHRIQVVDTVGAGDAFCAGYLSAMLHGLPADGRLRRACTTAAFVVGSRGDWEGLPHHDELPIVDTPAGSVIR